jgi:uncharacterized protein
MSFSNEHLPPDALPDWRQVELEPVSPRYAPYRMLSTLLRWTFIVLLLWFVPRLADPPGGPTAAPAIVAAAVGAVLTLLAGVEARRRGWALRQHDVIYRSGLLVRRTTVLPFRRVQHVETVSGPLERAFGLLRLTCYTAGGFSADLVIAGLETRTAERVRQFLLGRIADLDEPQAREENASEAPPAAAGEIRANAGEVRAND